MDDINTNIENNAFDEYNNNVKPLMDEAESTATMVDDVVNQMVLYYTSSIDSIMFNIKTDVLEKVDPDVGLVERYFAELTHALYFTGCQVEALGIRNDIAESMYKEVFNDSYLSYQSDASKKLTAATLTAMAENDSKYHTILTSTYNRAYKIVKFKVDSASDMCRTLSKMVSRRMQEMSLSTPEPTDGLGRRILNE